jgi:hypothetical protein
MIAAKGLASRPTRSRSAITSAWFIRSRRGVRMGENFRNEVDQILNLHSDHDQSLPQALALA